MTTAERKLKDKEYFWKALQRVAYMTVIGDHRLNANVLL